MRRFAAPLAAAAVFLSVPLWAQTPEAPATPAATISVQAKLVVVPVTVFDKKGLNTGLAQKDFAISVDGKPQTIRYFDKGEDQPLTVGLLIDVSRSQSGVLDQEQKAGDQFLASFLKPAAGNRPADRAFVLQFGHTAELLQDVTDSRPLLAAGLKEVGTESPGSADERADETQPSSQTDPNNSGSQGGSTQGNGQGGYGGYGRRGRGGQGGNGSPSGGDRARGGTVLYDAVFLASADVEAHQTGRRAVVLLTDGVDRHSKESLVEAIEAAQRADTVVYAIYYKGEENRGSRNGGFGFPGGGFPGGGGGYPGGGGGGYPGGGGRPGSDGTYADPDGRKILERICGETGGRMFQLKGKDGAADAFRQIGDELRAQYRIGFTPSAEAASPGYHPVQLSLTDPALRKAEVQTRDGYYTGPAKSTKP